MFGTFWALKGKGVTLQKVKEDFWILILLCIRPLLIGTDFCYAVRKVCNKYFQSFFSALLNQDLEQIPNDILSVNHMLNILLPNKDSDTFILLVILFSLTFFLPFPNGKNK